MSHTILSFDSSSATIGWSVLEIDQENNIHFVKCGYIKPPKKGNIIERIVNTRNQIQKLINNIKPDSIAIEEIIKFMKGHSTANTIIMLTSFNRMIGVVSYDYLGSSPSLYNVMSIRHGIKINKQLPKKEDIPELVSQHLGITFPYEYNKKNTLKVENFDKADATAVALYHAFVLLGKFKKKASKSKRSYIRKCQK